MEWLVVTVVAFLLVLGVVIGMARGSTARWERERRAVPAPRGPVAAPPAPPRGWVAPMRRAGARTADLVHRAPPPIRRPLEAVGVLGTTVLRRTRTLRDALGGRSGPKPSGDEAAGASVTAEPVPAPRPGGRAGVPSHGVGHALPGLTRRLTARLVHRHGEGRGRRPARR